MSCKSTNFRGRIALVASLVAAAVVLSTGGAVANAAPATPGVDAPASSASSDGAYTLHVISSDEDSIRFKVNFAGNYSLDAAEGALQVRDSSGRVVDEVGPGIRTEGQFVAGSFTVDSPDTFSFVKDEHQIVKRGARACSVGSAFASAAAGGMSGMLFGGPFGAGVGLGIGIASAFTCG